MKCLRPNRKGQLTIIAALLVAVVLISAVITTYSAIRYGSLQDQPQLLSAVDEIHLALKQVLGFTVGYYNSLLQVTGNTSYARLSAAHYFESGLVNIADIRPEWGASFNISALDLRANWYSNTSYSSGSMSLSYDLAGIGVYGMTYTASSKLDVTVLENVSNQSRLSITKDESEPLVNLAKKNLQFYRYESYNSTWEFVSPSVEPLVYENGTYAVDFPSGVDSNSYMVKVEDGRGIVVIASSFSGYVSTLVLNSTYSAPDYVDLNNSDVDSSPDKGTQSNFTAQQSAPDSIYDTLAEADIGGAASNVTLINGESFEGTWPPTGWSENPSGSNWNKESDRHYGTGSSSADFDGSGSGDLSTSGLNCSDAAAIYVDFWYYDEGCGNNEFTIKYYDGSTWPFVYQLGAQTENQWIHYEHKITDSRYFRSDFKIMFTASPNKSDKHAYVDLVTVRKETVSARYQLDLEEQFTNVNNTYPRQDLCIKTGALGTENLMVDVWSSGSWKNVATLDNSVSGSWKNVSITSYLASPTLTIRFKGSSEISDATPDSWNIDTVLIAPQPDISFFSSQQDSTIIVELLQNGTMRWLGQNLDLTTGAKPIPPIPVKAIHLNQTINGIDQEVPFQIEDWASEYRIPMGLTGNATLFSNRQMIVFLLNPKMSKFSISWNGSDEAVQTPLAFTNRYFYDNPSSGTLSNGRINLQFGNSFTVTSTVNNTSTLGTAKFMRINNEDSTYGAGLAYVIHHGVVRDIVQQEAEWGTSGSVGGADGSPNLYANIVLTLPANVTYYTYQLRLMFIDSAQSRTITDICPISLSTSIGSLETQTENGTVYGLPAVTNGTGTFYNLTGGSWASHHWSQFISNTKGTGILFTDSANQRLYAFDSFPPSPGVPTGALYVNSSSTKPLIELRPVTLRQVQFTNRARCNLARRSGHFRQHRANLHSNRSDSERLVGTC